MFKNYLKVALRNILKHKFFATINIVGLVIGMTCCLLIFVYIKDELSYDQFHEKSQQLYRVALHGRIGGQEIYTISSNPQLAQAMQTEIPGIEQATRIDNRGETVMKFEEKVFLEEDLLAVDSNFFQVFSFQLLQGDPLTALKEPNSIVLTPGIAEKYFGEPTAGMGKMLMVGDEAFKITGICADPPSNSHIIFKFLLSWSSFPDLDKGGWTNNSFYTYIVKNSNTKTTEVDSKLADMVSKYVGPELEKNLGVSFDKFREQGGIYSYYVYPMAETHLYTNDIKHDMQPKGDIRYVYIFGAIGVFILAIACINFMNLSTARSAGRAKEVGLRKTLGSQRGQMIWQFLSESFIYSAVSIFIAIAISYLILPYFNLLSGKSLTLHVLATPQFILVCFALILFVGFIAGSYPAFYLTSFSAVEVLKGKVRAGMKSKSVRSSLVVFQFAVSTFLIIATIIVYNQLSFLQNKDLGLDHHHIIAIESTGKLGNNQASFKNQILTLTGVQKASFTNNTFPGVNNTTVFTEKGTKLDKMMGKYYADWDHLETMQFKLAEGRFFSREFPSDSTACVINEAAVREFGWTDSAIGKEIWDYNGPQPTLTHVVGVVKDFNFESLRDNIRPLFIRKTEISGNLMVRYEGDPQKIIAALDNVWKQQSPGEPFEYEFMDEEFDELFRSEVRLRDIFSTFSVLAIFIACLGLFALAAFTTEQRTKEIGIRKALGASVMNLVILLSREFTRLVLIAIVPAIALGWYVTDQWLDGFAYRIDVNPFVYIGSALTAIAIAWVTVSYQSIKAASSNPVNSLRQDN